ncbi:ABC transporter permease [Virgibacillus sp. NKC19-3]|uniref:ABC transporter permease n=1 Tax=Virgibacillus saliphilus TaxID=2831674 RepID=UPI001C9B9053|nr:ABC transporter permease [Virgibacillus sp. NKC19-3]MBY7144582.1 ABC transporter permease [Virgibacillus sp. NKC19-3]
MLFSIDKQTEINDEHREKKLKSYNRWFYYLFKSKTGIVGIIIVFFIIFTALLAHVLSPYDPTQTYPSDVLVPPVWSEGGSIEHILGTDNLGRDLLSRIIYGTRISLLVGVFSVFVAGIIGLFIGLVAGYYGGLIDKILMRLVDAFLSIPNILFIIVILTIFTPGIFTLIFVIGATTWVQYARIIRGEVLSIREKEYVKAAKSIGVKNNLILMKHVLPNVFSTFIVLATLNVATTIILEASLSFLGIGIQPPDISWGMMLNSGRDYLATGWWIATFPGLAITITVLGIIFLGDWLRDVLDPRYFSKR